ncbi:hypothetical protein H2204_011562 [Knufia peltigerae]|uniref:Mannan endo-1,6-alpha-mannosidase n=1 Tax=Knufia peltigerae TaxID=1002370 RepID=A0AA38XU34_9EURO|nr:hypothetical protein H2204_011562 [Knufia peltigerae]
MHGFTLISILFLVLIPSTVLAVALDVDDRSSILTAAATIASGLQELYNGNRSGGTLGKWPFPPYYWWESGGAWSGMMEYWHYTGDNSYNNVMTEALVSQLGPANDFNMPSEVLDEGNDDQAFWVFAAISAEEYSFPQPPAPAPSWLKIVENSWQDYVARWNTTKCNGGLKWQFHPQNAGYYYKNSVSNGAFFQLSARLARLTGNQTYIHWANKIWDWTVGVGLIDNIYNVFDGTDETINCTGIDHHQWTYNVGLFLYGAAVLQNLTNGSSPWIERTVGLLEATNTFVSPFENATNIVFEAECELGMTCNTDQLSMKAYLLRWLSATSIMAPLTAGRVGEIIRASAQGAARACVHKNNGLTCGSKWYINGWDGTSGLGQQLSAMEAMYALLVNHTNAPMTLWGVHIRHASPSPFIAVTATEGLPVTSKTARPLFDHNGGSMTKVRREIQSVVATSDVVV